MTPPVDRASTKMGMVYLVGAGPGDPRLLTLRGQAVLAQADVVVYDRLIHPGLLSWARKTAQMVYVGKEPGVNRWPQDAINALLVNLGSCGRQVVRLKGGDPLVFGRGGEEALALRQAGIAFEIVPGVSAAIAAPAYAGIPATHRRISRSLTVVTGHASSALPLHGGRLEFEEGTLVVMMGLAELPRLVGRLLAAGAPSELPAAMVQWGSWGHQRAVYGTLGTLVELATEARLGTPSVIVVGRTVNLHDHLDWWQRLPYSGRRVVGVTEQPGRLQRLERLRELGAEVLQVNLATTWPRPMSDLLQRREELQRGALVVFDGPEAAMAFLDAWQKARVDIRRIEGRWVARDGLTQKALHEHGFWDVALAPSPSDLEEGHLGDTAWLVGVAASCGFGVDAWADWRQALAQRGTSIRVLNPVERRACSLEPLMASHVFEAPMDVAVFSSPEAVSLLARLRPPEHWGRLRQALLVGFPEAAEALRGLGLSTVELNGADPWSDLENRWATLLSQPAMNAEREGG